MGKNSTDITCSNFSAVCPLCTFMPLAQQLNVDDFQKDTHQYSKVIWSKAILINPELKPFFFPLESSLSRQVLNLNVSKYLQEKSCCYDSNGHNPGHASHVHGIAIMWSCMLSHHSPNNIQNKVTRQIYLFHICKTGCFVLHRRKPIQNKNKLFCGVWNDEWSSLKAQGKGNVG